MNRRIIGLACAAITVLASPALAQTDTTFTYQGRLDFQGQPYTGDADYRFTLWDAETGGSQIGDEQALDAVSVEAGLFTGELDFGANAFASRRWLEISVRTPAWDGQGSEPPFTTLDPRQPVTRAPYAIQTRGLFVDEFGRVGIGTDAPGSSLDVDGGIRARSGLPGLLGSANNGYAFTGAPDSGLFRLAGGVVILANNAAGVSISDDSRVGIGTLDPAPNFPLTVRGTCANSDGIQFQTSLGNSRWHLSQTGGGLDFVETGIQANRLYLEPGGDVGIGTSNPQARLHVNGEARMDGLSGVRQRYANVTFNVQGQFPESLLLNAELPDGTDVFHVRADGEVVVFGNLSVNVVQKGFLIDHPLDPANKSLAHNAVEGPGEYTFYSGNVVLDARGEAWVELPAYFDALNTQPTYQLTCVGGHAPVYVAEAIRENRFKIAGGREGLTVTWQVTGVRNDPYARDHPYQDVIEKTGAERGRYHYPAGYGMPDEMSTSRIPAEAVGSVAGAESVR